MPVRLRPIRNHKQRPDREPEPEREPDDREPDRKPDREPDRDPDRKSEFREQSILRAVRCRKLLLGLGDNVAVPGGDVQRGAKCRVVHPMPRRSFSRCNWAIFLQTLLSWEVRKQHR